MILTIIIVFISIIGLLAFHEFGHFIFAKKFGVKVEEFGFGIPPRIWGKKIGETIYSINLIPIGAFVRILGEEEKNDDPRSFTKKPIWQRILIILGGVLSFWIIAVILLSIIAAMGAPKVVEDTDNSNLLNPKVQILAVVKNSPAEKAGIRMGDFIEKMKSPEQEITIEKLKQVQDLANLNKGKEITITLERGKEFLEVSLVPRISYPEGEGAMGVSLARVAIKKYPWYQAPIEGINETKDLTIAAIDGWVQIFSSLMAKKGLPAGAEFIGPVGLFQLFFQMEQLGIIYFLRFVAIVSIFLALFNILPIPALDGGKMLFLIIEAIRKKPIKPELEQKITAAFFILLIGIMILVTIKDVIKLF